MMKKRIGYGAESYLILAQSGSVEYSKHINYYITPDLFAPQNSAYSYRKAAVVFSMNITPSQVRKFRIRLAEVADRITFCLAISEFIEVRESPAMFSRSSQGYSVDAYPQDHRLILMHSVRSRQ
ncbi:hypothetical protein V3C99_004703 [Haemonchus contortus]